jgi:hypothetical protein
LFSDIPSVSRLVLFTLYPFIRLECCNQCYLTCLL